MVYIILGLFLGTFLLVWILSAIDQTRSEIARMNITLNKIAKHVGLPDTSIDELKKLIAEGKEIEAVRRYRFDTGLSLKECEEYINSLGK